MATVEEQLGFVQPGHLLLRLKIDVKHVVKALSVMRRSKATGLLLPAALVSSLWSIIPVAAQSISGQGVTLSPVTLSQPAQIAQTPPPQFIPTDVTPFTVSPERNVFSPGFKFRLFQAMPSRLWFTAITEVSQRLDTNVFFTYSHPKADYAFRVLPNVTIGYNIAPNTSIYTNYFVIKDTFAVHNILNPPTTQSLSWGIQHNKRLGRKTNVQFSAQARELWQASHLHQFDFLPGVTLTHAFTPNTIVYASSLLQLRGGQYFVAPTREIDPFYTIGGVHRRGLWTFIVTDTLVTNFRHPPFNDSIPRQSNVTMIADFEIDRPLLKRFPSLLAFLRAEPIWNWDSHKAPGLSGFDFRFYGGLRMTVSKPSYYAAMKNMRQQIMQSEQPARGKPAAPKSRSRKSTTGSTSGSRTSPNNNEGNGSKDQDTQSDNQT